VFEPLRGLVAGTRRVSRGDFDVRLPERRSDEIGIVVSAFNEMTEKIAESQRALEERRRYLEAILENIGAGVVSTDAEGRVRTVNAASERIIGAPSAAVAGGTALELAAGAEAPAIFALLTPGDGTLPAFTSGELGIEGPEGRATVKYMRTRLEAEGRHFGTVLVFEDVTELIESKKLSAWVEMARQVAHEIKNPLTRFDCRRSSCGARTSRSRPSSTACSARHGHDPAAGRRFEAYLAEFSATAACSAPPARPPGRPAGALHHRSFTNTTPPCVFATRTARRMPPLADAEAVARLLELD
jgi:PAS domain S-box-containing protein